MNPTQIIIVAAAIVLFFLGLKLIKNVIKLIFLSLLIIVIVTGVTGFFFVKDFNNFRKGMNDNHSLYLLSEGEEYITGFTMKSYNITQAGSLKKSELEILESKEFDEISGDYYKIFVFNLDAFPNASNTENELLLSYLKGENEMLDVLDDFIPEGVADPKAGTFAALVIYNAKDDPRYILKGYKSENIYVYPETFMFKVIKFLIR